MKTSQVAASIATGLVIVTIAGMFLTNITARNARKAAVVEPTWLDGARGDQKINRLRAGKGWVIVVTTRRGTATTWVPDSLAGDW